MIAKKMNFYECPSASVVRLESEQIIASSTGVKATVGGWGNGGTIAGGEAEEGVSAQRGAWGNLWSGE